MITRYTSPKVSEPAPKLWSNCIVCDGIAYIAGLTSRNADGVTIDGKDEYEQTKIIFEKHKALIEVAGGTMADFTKLTIYVTRIQNNEMVWKARAEFFEGNFPACSLVEVSNLANPDSVNTAVLTNNQNQLYITTHDSRWQITNNWTPYINPDTDAYYLAETTFGIDFDNNGSVGASPINNAPVLTGQQYIFTTFEVGQEFTLWTSGLLTPA